ncbi:MULTISPECIES: hypothetical protein [unclassified Brevibacterium]|uniref:hypothetical protein n=1 Tax=unclassified Brevibacterium TaxID=2614124 RepID=UPI001092CDEE|nr:hypothetical protein [Brevibacterium sp. S22]TGD31607.1 hypothetical protein EB835_07655 [Brevibacterium sp. S22]
MRFLVALILGLAVMFGFNAIFDFFAMARPWGSILMGVIVGLTMLIVLLIWEAVRPTPPKGESAKAKEKAQKSEDERARARAERRARLAAEAGVSLEGIDGALPGSTTQPAEADSSDETAAEADSSEGESSEGESSEGKASEGESSEGKDPAEAAATTAGGESAQGNAPEADAPEADAAEADAPEADAAEQTAEQNGDTSSEVVPPPPPMPPSVPARPTIAPQAGAADAKNDDGTATPELNNDEAGVSASASSSDPGLEGPAEDPATLDPEEFDESAGGSSLEAPPTGEPGMSADALAGKLPEEADESADSADEEPAEDRAEDAQDPQREGPSTEENNQYRL